MGFVQGFLGGAAQSSSTRTTSLNNSYNVAGYTATATNAAGNASIATLSGALTANTLKTMLEVNRTGCRLTYFSATMLDATARTLRVVITVDGIVIYDRTSAANTTASRGCVLAGTISTTDNNPIPPIISTSSLKIEVASSLTETDKIQTNWIFNTEA